MDTNYKPTLNFTNESDQVEIHITFGYLHNEPTAALFHNDTLVLIPKDVLQIALEQGWVEPYCETTQDNIAEAVEVIENFLIGACDDAFGDDTDTQESKDIDKSWKLIKSLYKQ
tara:strand:+ start:520 stop:861 length:342 start_codon:yes stop_codon:yes gene_type:complete